VSKFGERTSGFFGGGGGGSIVGSSGYYGAFSSFDNQSATNPNEGYAMILGTTDSNNGVSIENDSFGRKTRITFANSGIYNIQFSAQLVNIDTSSEHDVQIWLRKNGETSASDVIGSTGRVSVPKRTGGVDGHAIPSWNYVISVSTATSQAQIGIGYYGLTSTTTNTLGLGSKTFTTNIPSTSTAFNVGTRVRVSGLDVTKYMDGVITSFAGNTLVVSVDEFNGSGSLSIWSFSVVGNSVFSYNSGLLTYLGSIQWTGTSAPVGGSNSFSYQWSQVDKLVTLRMNLVYQNNSSNTTAVVMSLPSDCPQPQLPTGVSGNNALINYGSGLLMQSIEYAALTSIGMGFSAIAINSTSSGFSIIVARGQTGAAYKNVSSIVQYYTT